MRTHTKLARSGISGGRSPLSGMFGQIRRTLVAPAFDRRVRRPLEDIDGWSDQAEVAFYEDGRLSRTS